MLCSNCSAVITPVVAVDVDGTLGDYHGHFLNFAADWLGSGLEPLLKASQSVYGYGGNTPFSEYCIDLFDIDLATYRQVKLAYRQGGMKRTMPMIYGAHDLCRTIKREGAELWITTTRPYLSLDNIVPDTVEWCRRHSIEYDGMLFDEDKYERLADRVDSYRVVAVLDDLPEMVSAASVALGSYAPILVLGKFNGNCRAPVMTDLITATEIVTDRIRQWKDDYGD